MSKIAPESRISQVLVKSSKQSVSSIPVVKLFVYKVISFRNVLMWTNDFEPRINFLVLTYWSRKLLTNLCLLYALCYRRWTTEMGRLDLYFPWSCCLTHICVVFGFSYTWWIYQVYGKPSTALQRQKASLEHIWVKMHVVLRRQAKPVGKRCESFYDKAIGWFR